LGLSFLQIYTKIETKKLLIFHERTSHFNTYIKRIPLLLALADESDVTMAYYPHLFNNGVGFNNLANWRESNRILNLPENERTTQLIFTGNLINPKCIKHFLNLCEIIPGYHEMISFNGKPEQIPIKQDARVALQIWNKEPTKIVKNSNNICVTLKPSILDYDKVLDVNAQAVFSWCVMQYQGSGNLDKCRKYFALWKDLNINWRTDHTPEGSIYAAVLSNSIPIMLSENREMTIQGKTLEEWDFGLFYDYDLDKLKHEIEKCDFELKRSNIKLFLNEHYNRENLKNHVNIFIDKIINAYNFGFEENFFT